MPPKPKFQEGEKVLCYHGPLLYEAKCIAVDPKDGKLQYRIHYNGWNKNWDEWVQETRIVKNNEAGIQKQKELLKNHGLPSSALTKKTKKATKLEKEQAKIEKKEEKKSAKESAKEKNTPKEKDKAAGKDKKEKEKEKKDKDPKDRPSTPQPIPGEKRKYNKADKGDKAEEEPKEKNKEDKDKISTPAVASAASTPVPPTPTTEGQTPKEEPKRKRLRLDNTVEAEETYLSKIEVKIKIPDDLKPWLVDDWDLITRQKMLVILPCKMTVEDIIEDYIKSKTAKNNSVNKDAMIETMNGCKDYFNVMLGTQLLYKFERPQYGELMKKMEKKKIKSELADKPMSSIYGAVHFLRLFVRLGAMLAYTSLDERTVHILLNHIHDFLKYLSKKGSDYLKIGNYEIATPDYHRKAI